MTDQSIFTERATFSRVRLGELRRRLATNPHVTALPDLSIFASGSYGRLEASEHSDIDLFFIYKHDRPQIDDRKTRELRLFGTLIEMAVQMDFPAFSNDSQYLTTVECSGLLAALGSPEDDYKNYFTLRMLMILESRPVFQDEVFNGILRAIFESYYRDYPDHEASFEPWFLLNDIGRFWKTLLLNYEHRRNQNSPEMGTPEQQLKKNKQKVKNFKLKFSRMTTCFATVAALGTAERPVSIDDLMQLVQLTPRERLEWISSRLPQLKGLVDDLLIDYAWFMEQTALTEENLRRLFEDKASRVVMFERANTYSDKMFRLLSAIENTGVADGRGSLLRYLVI